MPAEVIPAKDQQPVDAHRGQIEAHGGPAHDQTLFRGEPVGDQNAHAQTYTVADAVQNDDNDKVGRQGSGKAPAEDGDGQAGHRKGQKVTGAEFLDDHTHNG